MYTVVVVDDDPDYRLVVRLALSDHPPFTVVGEADEAGEAVELVGRTRPDFVLLDMGMPGTVGRSVLSGLKEVSPQSAIIATSTSPEEDGGLCLPVDRVLGHISKGVPPSRLGVEILLVAELIDAVDTALDVAATRLPRELTSAASARRFVEQTLSRWQCDEAIDTVKLLMSELVGNAVGHARSEVAVSVHLMPDRLRVEVFDDDPGGPRRRVADAADASGRGLAMVETIADAWGVSPRGPGKIVWFELPRPNGSNGDSSTPGAAAESTPRKSSIGT